MGSAGSNAADCKPQSKIISDVWRKWADELSDAVGGKAATVTDVADSTLSKLIAKMNAFAKNGWATIGPRVIEFGETQKGTLRIPGDRTFLSSHPLESDRATIRLTKTDGRGGARVTICKVDEHGRYTNLVHFDFDKGKAGLPDSETRTVSGLTNHFLQVLLDGSGGGLGSRLAYELEVAKL